MERIRDKYPDDVEAFNRILKPTIDEHSKNANTTNSMTEKNARFLVDYVHNDYEFTADMIKVQDEVHDLVLAQ